MEWLEDAIGDKRRTTAYREFQHFQHSPNSCINYFHEQNEEATFFLTASMQQPNLLTFDLYAYTDESRMEQMQQAELAKDYALI